MGTKERGLQGKHKVFHIMRVQLLYVSCSVATVCKYSTEAVPEEK